MCEVDDRSRVGCRYSDKTRYFQITHALFGTNLSFVHLSKMFDHAWQSKSNTKTEHPWCQSERLSMYAWDLLEKILWKRIPIQTHKNNKRLQWVHKVTCIHVVTSQTWYVICKKLTEMRNNTSWLKLWQSVAMLRWKQEHKILSNKWCNQENSQ